MKTNTILENLNIFKHNYSKYQASDSYYSNQKERIK